MTGLLTGRRRNRTTPARPRVLLTGIHLMRTHETVADIGRLAEVVPEAPAYLGDLVAAKRVGEHDRFEGSHDRVADDVTRLLVTLTDAKAATSLPDQPAAQPALHELLVRLRLGTWSA